VTPPPSESDLFALAARTVGATVCPAVRFGGGLRLV
jgi:hypothetical protein